MANYSNKDATSICKCPAVKVPSIFMSEPRRTDKLSVTVKDTFQNNQT